MSEAPDQLDVIVAQWRRERPELDTAALATIGRLFRVASLADPVLARPLRELGLRPGWFDLLAALRRVGEPYQLNPTELMRATMLSSGGMTKRLDRIAAAGLIERHPDPNDRRGTLVALTEQGKATIDTAIETHVRNETELLKALTPADRRTLDHLLRTLLAAIESDKSLSRHRSEV
jgi:DNA-binding MarR family transcriptional regulator